MHHPFHEDEEDDDRRLVALAQAGDQSALEELVNRHQPWIYNIASRMLYVREDVEDATQDILIRMMAGVRGFRGESKFRTWLYRLATNHILNLKKQWEPSGPRYTFEWFAGDLDATGLADVPDPRTVPVPVETLIAEAKISCMAAMLLCLDGRQRLVYTLGEIFGVSDSVGAEVVGITPANFRQILSRARQDLYRFLDGKCGLVNEQNPCRCPKKIRGFMERGYLNPHKLQFAEQYRRKVRDIAPGRGEELLEAAHRLYAALYREHPFAEPPPLSELVRKTLAQVSLDSPQ
jgi:RNA polymerase sigma factor (sigma-70 family)